MPDRKNLASTLWFASSLALLALILVAPIRILGFATATSGDEGLRRHLAGPPARSTADIDAAIPTDAVPPMKAPAFEKEEQEKADALDEARVSFLIACSFRKSPDRQSIAPRSTPSSCPLRC